MSIPAETVYCTQCDFEQPFGKTGNYYRYVLNNCERIFAPIGPGYCADCDEIMMIHYGLSVSKLKEEVSILSNRLQEITGRRLVIFGRKKSKDEIENLQYEISKKENYLSILNGNDSCYNCLECGSRNVIPLDIFSRKFLKLDGTPFIHHNCGGELLLRQEDIRIFYESEEVLIKPVFQTDPVDKIQAVISAASQVNIGEIFKLNIEINRPYEEFESPVFDDFIIVKGPIRETKQKMSKGNRIGTAIYLTYYLKAFKEGIYQIVPAKFVVAGKNYQSNSLEINVDSSNSIKRNNELVIPNYEEISDEIIKLIDLEKYILTSKKEQLMGFESKELFDASFRRKFMIERFLFVFSYLKIRKFSYDLQPMKRFVTAISCQTYNINKAEASYFINKRIEFYYKELEMLYSMEHPHPGKIIWSLYHPSHQERSHDLKVAIEDNFIAGIYLIKLITETIDKDIIFAEKVT